MLKRFTGTRKKGRKCLRNRGLMVSFSSLGERGWARRKRRCWRRGEVRMALWKEGLMSWAWRRWWSGVSWRRMASRSSGVWRTRSWAEVIVVFYLDFSLCEGGE